MTSPGISRFQSEGAGDEPPEETAEEAPPMVQPFYGSVDEFVREFLVKTYRRCIDGKGAVWAADWWKYPEAVCRLDALWQAWEVLRLDPALGLSAWWKDHADHHMGILLSTSGPFPVSTVTAETSTKGTDPLPYVAPDASMFPDVRRSGAL